MNFKSWKDFYIFVRDYAKYSCLNCKYGSDKDKTKSDAPESDVKYSHHFCTYWVAMVRWDLQPFVCKHWKNGDDKVLPEDDDLFLLDEHILKKLEKGNRKWSIEEIREMVS